LGSASTTPVATAVSLADALAALTGTSEVRAASSAERRGRNLLLCHLRGP
jgi:hypothetical protein